MHPSTCNLTFSRKIMLSLQTLLHRQLFFFFSEKLLIITEAETLTLIINKNKIKIKKEDNIFYFLITFLKHIPRKITTSTQARPTFVISAHPAFTTSSPHVPKHHAIITLLIIIRPWLAPLKIYTGEINSIIDVMKAT